jgi:transcriptional regulator NrdR family protein
MNCPKCNEAVTRVIDSRCKGDGKEVHRRRKCVACGTRFTTLECVEILDKERGEKIDWQEKAKRLDT